MTIQRERFGDHECAIDVQADGGHYTARPLTVDAEGQCHDISNEEGLPVEFEAESALTAYKLAELFLAAQFGPLGGRAN